MNETSESMAPGPPHVSVGTRIMRIVAALLVAAVLVGIGFWINSLFIPVEKLYELATVAVAEQDFAQAEKYSQKILAREPEANRALLLAAMVAASSGKYEQSLEFVERVKDDKTAEAAEAHCVAGDVLLKHYKRPWDALDEFEIAAKLFPSNINAHNFLPHIYRLGTRTWEMIPHEVALAKAGFSTPRRLFELSLGHELHTDQSVIRKCSEVVPDDPIVRLGQADVAMYLSEFDQAEELYRGVISSHPEILEAHVRLGKVFLQTGSAKKFYQWNAELPAAAAKHPLTWSIRGTWADENDQPQVAIRCFGESVHLDPNHLKAVYRLGKLLVAEGQPAVAKPYLQRAKLLEIYTQATRSVNVLSESSLPDARQPLQCASFAYSLGNHAEAYAWLSLVLTLDPQHAEASDMKKRLKDTLPRLPMTRSIQDIYRDLALDLSKYPLPDWKPEEALEEAPSSGETLPVQVTFENMAASTGIEFKYFKGGDPDIRGLTHIYRFTGGGVAVLDFDCDGWPDLYLTQGAESPLDLKQTDHLDRLYRNTGAGRFEDVTEAAGISENSYSQGATVGDFNNDGFPDLYVANIGGNRFYRNNGDGTFEDITAACGIAGSHWTSSCLLADLNGDSLPDIYDVNYLQGQSVLNTVCRDEKGKHHACMPLQFPSDQDLLYVNRGDGTFENVTKQSGITTPHGKGLGIVAADVDGSGKLNLFVANDGVANFYFVNETDSPTSLPKFSEQGLLIGAAYNSNGENEACMGVAVGDSDADGRLDFFVTNFTGETNTLYRVQENQLFLDATAAAGLSAAGKHMLGFGTQFLDGALRGTLDLIATNGHIDYFEAPEIAYEMPPQYFYNNGDGTFVELAANSLGPFFEGKYLGRGMARLDWNRDGKEDVAISHLDVPAALLTNTTAQVGHFLTIRLVGVSSSRDAIGTTLTLHSAGRTQVRQLTAGDGYQASNERKIIFGLGESETIDSLEIRWPSGVTQEFTNLAGDQDYLCIEGTGELHSRLY